jgi:hypothetical protein
MSVDVAVDDLAADLWDAPYQKWVTFHFDELFAGITWPRATTGRRRDPS